MFYDLWFATRGAGAVSLLMFTAATCLGLVTVTRFQATGWPRFFNYEMHRRVSLLAIVFLAVHVLAAVFDPFTSLGIGAALVLLASTYRPIPVALGVIALYLFVALIATSLLAQAHRTAGLASRPLVGLRDVAARRSPWAHGRHRRLVTLDAGDRRRVRHRGRPVPRLARHGRQPEPLAPCGGRRHAVAATRASPAGCPMTPRLLSGPSTAAGAESLAAYRARMGELPRPDDPSAVIPVLAAAGLLGAAGPASRSRASGPRSPNAATATRSCWSTGPRGSPSPRRTACS